MGVLDAGINRANALGGRLRLLIAPVSEPLPTWFDDIFDMVSPYAVNGTWEELGGTTDSTTYEMSLDSEEWYFQQSAQALGERLQEQRRSISTTLGEITPDSIRYSEEGGADTTVVAAANVGGGKTVRSGAIDTRTVYRIALIGERDQAFGGTVTEPGGLTRGPLVGLIAHRAQIAPEDQEIEFDAEDLVGREIQWNLYPDSSITASNENTVTWMFENAATIAAV